MVRRPAAVLSPLGLGLALLYFLAAPALPALPDGDVAVLVAGGAGLLLVAATALTAAPAYDSPFALALAGLGAGLLAGALNAAGVGAGANVVEALLAAAAGLLFARVLSAPAIALAVPLFVALVSVLTAGFQAPDPLPSRAADVSDPLTLDLPAWGDAGSAGDAGVLDMVFLAAFAGWAWRLGLRRRATVCGLALGLLAAFVLEVALDRAIPALVLIAAGYLLPNADRLARLLRAS